MTNYNKVFDEKQYRSVSKKAALYYLERAKSAVLPLIVTDVPDAKEYTHPYFAEASGVTGGIEWNENERKMSVRHTYETYKLPRISGEIQINNADIANFGPYLIADKHEAEIAELVYEIDYAAFHGAKNDQGYQLQEGLIGQLTSLQNKGSAADSDCSTKGEIWYWLKDMIEDIPFAMRESGPDMILWINELTYANASAPDRIYQDKVEWDFIYEQFIGPKATHGRKIGQVIITNMINAEASDNTDGDNADTVDTITDDGRMLLCVPDKRWGARVVSRGFSLVGEQQHMLHVDQLYGMRGRAIAFDADAWNYTEALSF